MEWPLVRPLLWSVHPMNPQRPYRQSHWKEHVPRLRQEKDFHWRGREVSRLEGFSDAVFAFGVTLLIVALEVPHTYAGFLEMLTGFPAFVASFALLMVFWNSHYRYFRRYGIEDAYSRYVTYAILLLVLFSVYPVKFLFSAWLGGHHGDTQPIQTVAQFKTISVFFGLGLASIFALFAALYWHALRLRAVLQLTNVETVRTRQSFVACLISVGSALAAVAFASTRSIPLVVMSAWVYALIPVGLVINHTWHRREVRRLSTGAYSKDR